MEARIFARYAENERVLQQTRLALLLLCDEVRLLCVFSTQLAQQVHNTTQPEMLLLRS